MAERARTRQAAAQASQEAFDVLTAKASQLEAALRIIEDDGFAPFEGLAEVHRRNYLWLCAELASEVREAAQQAAGPRATRTI